MTFSQYLVSLGWTAYAEGFLNPAGDAYVDLSGDYGYAWEMSAFLDADDADGIARVMWVSTNASGDTLAELAAAIAPAALKVAA